MKKLNSNNVEMQALDTPAVRVNRPSPEDIFLKDVRTLITNLLIDNPNYKSDYYFKDNNSHFNENNTMKLIKDTKDRAKYILERIDSIEHLIKME